VTSVAAPAASAGDPREEQIILEPDTRVVLVEGNYVMLGGMQPWAELLELFDERWFISCDLECARERVIARHVQTGLTVEEATQRADDNDVPNGVLIEDQSKEYASRVVQSI
jgi:pantothenate kinase